MFAVTLEFCNDSDLVCSQHDELVGIMYSVYPFTRHSSGGAIAASRLLLQPSHVLPFDGMIDSAEKGRKRKVEKGLPFGSVSEST